jgi:hypothetical protein
MPHYNPHPPSAVLRLNTTLCCVRVSVSHVLTVKCVHRTGLQYSTVQYSILQYLCACRCTALHGPTRHIRACGYEVQDPDFRPWSRIQIPGPGSRTQVLHLLSIHYPEKRALPVYFIATFMNFIKVRVSSSLIG